MKKNIKTFESFWNFRKKTINNNKIENDTSIKEFDDLDGVLNYFNKKGIKKKLSFYNDLEKKKISLFRGDIQYLTNQEVQIFDYKFTSKIGLGLSDNTITVHYFLIYKNTTDNDNYYILTYFINGDVYKYYLCDNLDNCLRKIKKIKKDNEIFKII